MSIMKSHKSLFHHPGTIRTALGTIAVAGALAFTNPASAAVSILDLGAPEDFFNNFRTNYTGTPIGSAPSGGLSNSATIDATAGGGTQAWFSNAYYTPLAIGQSLSVSQYFQYKTNTVVGGIKLGFSTDPSATANILGMLNSGNFGYFGWYRYPSSSLASELWSNRTIDGNSSLGSSGTAGEAIVDGNWYQQSFSLTKTGAGAFTMGWSLANSDSAGVVGTTIIGGTSPINYAAFDTTLYVYTAVENGNANGAVRYIDGMRMQSDANVVSVPEPSTALMLTGGVGLLGLLRRRRTA